MPLLLMAVLGALAAPGEARAYVRQTVRDDPGTFLFWSDRYIVMRPDYASCLDANPDDVREAVLRSMDTWMYADRDGVNCTDISLVEGEAPTGYYTNLDGGDPDHQNMILWRYDGWPGSADPNALAITTILYDPPTGEIIDADIDVNGVGFHWTATDDAPEYDVQNTITHELGHLIGLAHSPETNSTMYASAPIGEVSKRTLSPDDIDAVCNIYPTGHMTPRGYGRAGGELTSGSACGSSVAGADGRGHALGWVVVPIAAAIVARLRRRPRR